MFLTRFIYRCGEGLRIRPIGIIGMYIFVHTSGGIQKEFVLRRIFGGAKQGQNLRIRYKDELHDLYKEIDLETPMKLMRQG